MTKLYKPDNSFITINLAASAAAMLSLALIGLIMFVLIKGLSYFIVYPTVNVQITDKHGNALEYYAQLYDDKQVQEEHVLLVYHPNTQKNQQLFVHDDNIIYRPIIHPIWTLHLNDGSQIFASHLTFQSSSEPNKIERYSRAAYSDLRDEIYQLHTQLRTLTTTLIPLNIELATFTESGSMKDKIRYEKTHMQIMSLMAQKQQLETQLNGIQIHYQQADGTPLSIPLYQVDYLIDYNGLSWLENERKCVKNMEFYE